MKRISLIITCVMFTLFTNAQNIFDPIVHSIDIYFNTTNWDDSLDIFYANNIGERLIADSIIINGNIDQDVGVKYKGNSSYNVNNIKNPLNIKLDYINNGQSIDGYNVLKLSNGFRDPSLVREILSYDIAREYMPAPKVSFANVSVNGVLIGIYSCIQSIDDDFTNENFYERKGPLFKAENTGAVVPNCNNGPLGILKKYSDTLCYQKSYEMQSTDDWGQLDDFLDTLNNDFSSIEYVFDIDRAIWMMAFENLIVALDGPIHSIPHNFYLFKDNNGRFSPIIWDMNMSLGGFTMGLPNPVTNQDLQQLDVFHENSNNQNKLTSTILSSVRYKKMYIAHMKTILNEFFINGLYNSMALSYQSLINNSILSDPNLFYSFSEILSATTNTVDNIIGLSELMEDRIIFLQSLPEFSSVSPSISNTVTSPQNVLPHSTVFFTSNIINSNYAFLAYRYNYSDKFEKVEMFDDGMHNDGAPGDNVFGISLNVDARDMQYYIYAENNDAAIFSPQRAEKEFHKLVVAGGLVINEVMASNVNSVADQDGEYDDWVELYNNNSFSINLNGYYLSDNENDLTKWSFPNINIAPNSYLVVWCDTAGNSQSGLHTNYRLSSDQEEVYLTDPLGVVVDAIHYVNMPEDISYSRVPNGEGPFQNQLPTYSSNNNSISSVYEDNKKEGFLIFPNPVNDNLTIIGLDIKEISIFNICGQNVLTKKIDDISTTINTSGLKAGVYFVKNNYFSYKLVKQ